MDLENKTLNELREIAKEKGVEKYSSMRKADLIRALSGEGKKPAEAAKSAPAGKPVEEKQARPERREVKSEKRDGQRESAPDQRRDQNDRRQNYHNNNMRSRYHDGSDGVISVQKERQIEEVAPTELKDLDSGITKNGILEIMTE